MAKTALHEIYGQCLKKDMFTFALSSSLACGARRTASFSCAPLHHNWFLRLLVGILLRRIFIWVAEVGVALWLP